MARVQSLIRELRSCKSHAAAKRKKKGRKEGRKEGREVGREEGRKEENWGKVRHKKEKQTPLVC